MRAVWFIDSEFFAFQGYTVRSDLKPIRKKQNQVVLGTNWSSTELVGTEGIDSAMESALFPGSPAASLLELHPFYQGTYHCKFQKVKETVPLDRHTCSPWDGWGTGGTDGCKNLEHMPGVYLFKQKQ